MSTQTSPLALPAPAHFKAPTDLLAGVAERAQALRKAGVQKASALAIRVSTNLSRAAFAGLMVMPFVHAPPAPPAEIVMARAHAAPIHRRTVRIVRVPIAPAPAPETPIAEDHTDHPTDVADVKKERAARHGDPQKFAGDASADPKHEPPVATADPEKPVIPKVAEKDKPNPPPPIPPGQQPAAPWSEDQIAAANKQCDQLLAGMTFVATPEPPEREGICGAPAPRTLKSLGQSHVAIEPPQMLNCPMIAGLNNWLTDKLQPAAQKAFGSPIVAMLGAASYSCRNRYGLAKAPISEHAFMNAIDIAGFKLANGKIIKVSHDWKAPRQDQVADASTAATSKPSDKKLALASKLGAAKPSEVGAPNGKEATDPNKASAKSKETEDARQKSAFLHEMHDGACSIFGTVLGPDANDAHHDHFHLDMKERKYRSICQ